ncbi:serine hydrolase [Vagococcus fessus]|uniref:Beta-lactamase class A catalytic domain-containing protein n=1 Tax=Vagococcus fessus TaxID=120370 RepID=A0A430A7S2_9ENTE|nr:serine hydrolase [Vagococcus fessus]RSU03158.1 hypothetical protein CBF31_05425 [Vagococcus fessus]
MFCEDCEEELKETDKVCQVCGKKVKQPIDKKKYLMALALVTLVGGTATAGVVAYKNNQKDSGSVSTTETSGSKGGIMLEEADETEETSKDKDKPKTDDKSKDKDKPKTDDKSKDKDKPKTDDKSKDKDKPKTDDKSKNKDKSKGEDKSKDKDKSKDEDKFKDKDKSKGEDKAKDKDKSVGISPGSSGQNTSNLLDDGTEEIANPEVRSALDTQLKNVYGTNSYYFQDISVQQAFETNDQKQLAAGMINLYIMQMLFDKVEQGKMELSGSYKLTSKDKTSGTGVLKDMSDGTSLTNEKLVEYMLVDSDNTATNVLINRLGGLGEIEKFIQSKGYSNTHINRKMADMGAISQGKENYTSVKDTGNLLSKLYKHDLVSKEMDDKMLAILSKTKDKAKLRKDLPKDVTVYSNSGQFSNYGVINDAMIVKTKDKTFVLVVLMQNGDQYTQVSNMNTIGSKVYNLMTGK